MLKMEGHQSSLETNGTNGITTTVSYEKLMPSVNNNVENVNSEHNMANGQDSYDFSSPKVSKTIVEDKAVVYRRRDSAASEEIAKPENITKVHRKSAAGMCLNLLNIALPTVDRPKSPGITKLNPFLLAKYDYMFDLLYAPPEENPDTITRTDFWKLLKLAAAIHNWRPSDEGFRDASSGMVNIWAGLIKGTLVYKAASAGGVIMEISRQDWQHYWGDFVEASTLVGDKWPVQSKDSRVEYQCQKDFKDFIFKLMDVNCDGAVDKNEYLNCMLNLGVSSMDSEYAFDKIIYYLNDLRAQSSPNDEEEAVISADKSSSIHRHEFDQIWYRYLTSTNVDDPCNCILGHHFMDEWMQEYK